MKGEVLFLKDVGLVMVRRRYHGYISAEELFGPEGEDGVDTRMYFRPRGQFRKAARTDYEKGIARGIKQEMDYQLSFIGKV